VADQDGGIPTDAEVERQLNRMLAHKSFTASPNRAMLLEYVVKNCLLSQEISEDIIGYALFPGYAPDVSNDVRVTASNLRKTLSEYYAGDGADDLVRVGLPRGPKYRPDFTYNPRAACVAHYRLGREYLSRTHYVDILLARDEFVKARLKTPAFTPALSAQADAELRAQVLNRFVEGERSAFDFLRVEEIAVRAVEQDPAYWHGHYMHAVAKACQWQWEEAKKSFEKAVQLNPEECGGRFWYSFFLMVTADADSHLQTVEAVARHRAEDLLAQLTAGVLFYLSGAFQKAWEFLDTAYRLDIANWIVRVMFAMVNISLGELGDADGNLSLVHALPESTHRPYEKMVPGLVAQLRVKRGDVPAAKNILLRMKRNPHRRPEQLLMAHLAVGETKKAIEALEELAEEHHPLMLAVRHWPLLDPLRDNPAFEALIERMNLPRSR
jgi:tetratricopeptide (TPR) repeat protein